MYNSRRLYLDFLKIISILAVVCIHTTCQVIDSSVFTMPSIGSLNWTFAIILNAMSRFCVPIFLMVSGALFIGRDISVKALYKKYILRIVIAYLFWSCFYALFYYDARTMYDVIYHTLYGAPRFGFLCYLIGLYMITPVLSKIAENKVITKYFLSLSLVFCFFFPQLISIIGRSNCGQLAFISDVLSVTLEKMNIQFVLGMTGYYFLGYYLDKCDFNKKERVIIYALGIFGVTLTVVMTIMLSVREQVAMFDWFNYLWVNVLLESVAIFVFVKYFVVNISFNTTIKKIVVKLSQLTLGVYVIHTFLLDKIMVNVFGINANSGNSPVSILVITVCIFIVSLFFSYLLKQIPVVKKWLV